jgi:basic membrane protein A and related proteins
VRVPPLRLLGGLVALNLALILVGHAVAPDGKAAPRGGDGSGHGVTIGLVFDVGGRDDKSFNDAAWRGLAWAQRDFGVEVITIEPSDGADREAALRQLAARGDVDLVIGVGFIFSADLERLAAQFPNVPFAGVDYAPSPGVTRPPPNLAGLRFREHEGSFLVGAVAGWTTRSKVVGFVGGMKIPLIRKFEAGYIAGVKHVCPRCRVLSAYAGTEPKAFADPTLGQELASAQYDQGADIIYHASGKTGAGVLAAARARRRMAIGVDSDQFHEAPCCVLTSMVKQVDVAVHEVIGDVVAKRFTGGMRELGLAENGVGFVSDANNRAMLPPELAERVNGLRREIISGAITVPSQ